MFVVLLRGSGSQVAGAVEQVCCRLHPPGSRGVARKMYAIVSVDKKKTRKTSPVDGYFRLFYLVVGILGLLLRRSNTTKMSW